MARRPIMSESQPASGITSTSIKPASVIAASTTDRCMPSCWVKYVTANTVRMPTHARDLQADRDDRLAPVFGQCLEYRHFNRLLALSEFLKLGRLIDLK